MIGSLRLRWAEGSRRRRFERALAAVERSVQEKRFGDALADVEKAVAVDPGEPVAQAYVGWVRFSRGEFSEARERLGAFVKAVGRSNLRPASWHEKWLPEAEPGAHLGRAARRLARGDWREARTHLGAFVRDLVRARPRPPEGHEKAQPVAGLLARTYYHLGRMGKCRSWMRRTLAFGEDQPEDLYYRGLLAVSEQADRIRGVDPAIGWILRADVLEPDFLHERIEWIRARMEREPT